MIQDDIRGLVRRLSTLLLARQFSLAVAESCTGGLIAAFITELPGSSTWFDRGFVTYSNLAKHQMIAVPEALLDQYGAVSKETACAMAEGALQHSVADMALSVTGIAGPGGATATKPVGMVHFAWAFQGQVFHEEKLFSGDRQAIRYQSCYTALEGAVNKLFNLC